MALPPPLSCSRSPPLPLPLAPPLSLSRSPPAKRIWASRPRAEHDAGGGLHRAPHASRPSRPDAFAKPACMELPSSGQHRTATEALAPRIAQEKPSTEASEVKFPSTEVRNCRPPRHHRSLPAAAE
ncbi:hypothetical protein U9M48_032996 [Paspalum notatum var. saurae]|uniref:Uncharacterized protein n=1 Tax=Paspalum notatum var. saurae TaxID=547442 RepID=A0AAQ3U9N7_PASNO